MYHTLRQFAAFFLTLLGFSTACFSQAKEDSLRRLLSSKVDTIQLSSALALADHFILVGDEDSITKYLQLSERLTPKNSKRWESWLLITKAREAYQTGNHTEAENLLNDAYSISNHFKDHRALIAVGNLSGNIQFSNSRYQRSLEHYLTALKVAEEKKITAQLGALYNNISAVLFQMDKKDESFKYKSRAMQAHLREGSSVGAIITGYNLCSQYNAEHKYDSAERYCKKALNLADSIGMQEGILRVKNKLANVLLNKDELDETIRLSLEVLATDPAQFHQQYSFSNLSQAYKDKGNLQSAAKYATKCLELANGMTDLSGLASVFELQYDLHKQMGNFETALKFHEEFKATQDSFLTQTNFAKVTELQEKYESVRKQQEIDNLNQISLLQQVKLSQKNTLMAAVAIIAIVLTIAIFMYARHHVENEKRKSNDMKQRLLRSQMNPHFLFNALGAIQQFVYQKRNPIETGDYLGRFSQLTRMILNHTQEDFITLEEEITFLTTYLELQKLRFDVPFEYNIVISQNLESEELMIPPMFTQPFIENSIEHGILNKQEKGKIEIFFSSKNDQLEIVLQDNGIGREKASFKKRNEKHRSLATKVTFERLKIMQKGFRKKTAMAINDLFDKEKNVTGTQVVFNLPLIYNH